MLICVIVTNSALCAECRIQHVTIKEHFGHKCSKKKNIKTRFFFSHHRITLNAIHSTSSIEQHFNWKRKLKRKIGPLTINRMVECFRSCAKLVNFSFSRTLVFSMKNLMRIFSFADKNPHHLISDSAVVTIRLET